MHKWVAAKANQIGWLPDMWDVRQTKLGRMAKQNYNNNLYNETNCENPLKTQCQNPKARTFCSLHSNGTMARLKEEATAEEKKTTHTHILHANRIQESSVFERNWNPLKKNKSKKQRMASF